MVVSLLPPGELWRGMLLILQKLGGRFWVCRFDTVDGCEAKSEIRVFPPTGWLKHVETLEIMGCLMFTIYQLVIRISLAHPQ